MYVSLFQSLNHTSLTHPHSTQDNVVVGCWSSVITTCESTVKTDAGWLVGWLVGWLAGWLVSHRAGCLQRHNTWEQMNQVPGVICGTSAVVNGTARIMRLTTGLFISNQCHEKNDLCRHI